VAAAQRSGRRTFSPGWCYQPGLKGRKRPLGVLESLGVLEGGVLEGLGVSFRVFNFILYFPLNSTLATNSNEGTVTQHRHEYREVTSFSVLGPTTSFHIYIFDATT
jgi:hypothetical protein